MSQALQVVSALIIPAIVLCIPWYAHLKRVPVYEEFVRGAGRAFGVGVRIIPYLVAMLMAVAILRASGALDYLALAAAPLTRLVGLPPDLLPLALVRPLSGSGALALLAEATRVHGPDTYVGRLAAVMVGCTETTFYVLSVYFGAAGVKRLRYAVALGLIADLAGLLAAVVVCRITFGNT
ncbi:MAG: spore maturation protein [Betaproteobacteria bacterium]